MELTKIDREPESKDGYKVAILKTLKKKRSIINAEIAKLKRKGRGNPENKAEGAIYYHYTPHITSKPRITVAAHVNASKRELYYGVVVTSSKDVFVKKEGRIRAMGKAVSTRRSILRINDTSHSSIRERLAEIAKREFFNANNRQRYVRKNEEE